MTEFLGYTLDALAVVFSWQGALALVISVFMGLIFGMLPGLTATMAVALLTGLTYSFDGGLAVLSLLGVYVGSISGGCQSAILLNIPGTPASAATAMDGHPIAREGRGAFAIFIANHASFFGTVIGTACVAVLTPIISGIALKFQSYEMFLLCVFGIIICGSLTSGGRPIKGWISGFVGLLVAMVGRDTVHSFARFSFGNMNLTASISLLPVMIGLFGFPEIVHSFSRVARNVLNIEKFNQKDGWAVLKRNKLNIVRSALLGMSMGAIPGVGEDTGGWLAYWSEKKVHQSDKWGKGEINGVVSAEAGNNAAVGGAIIPVLSLAIPGSAPAAVLLAAFWMHGYRPGPLLMSETPEFLYLVVVSMMFASLVMVLIANNMAKITVKVLQVDQRILMPIVFVCCVIGAFVVNNRLFDIKLMFVFGLLGVAMSYMHYPSAPFLLGVVMGNMADENLRRALMLSDGSILPFFTRPICIFFLLFIAVLVVQQLPCYPALKEKLFGKKKEA